MILRDTSELCQPLAKETMVVLTAVSVSTIDDVDTGVGDSQMTVHPLCPQYLGRVAKRLDFVHL